MRSVKPIVAAVAACVLVACGGGGGGGAGDAPAAMAWQGAQFVVTDVPDVDDVDVAINANGVGHVVWVRDTVSEDITVFSRGYRDGVWGPVQSVGDVVPGRFAFEPQVVALPDGEALAVWKQNEGIVDSVMSSRTVGGVWKQPEPIPESTGGSVESVKVAADEKGNAVVVWSHRFAPAAAKIRGVTFRNGAFGIVQNISSGASAVVSGPDLAIDAQGRALAVWAQHNDQTGVSNIVAKANVGEVWQSELTLNPQATEEAENPRVAVGLNGAASVVWEEGGGKRLNGRSATDFVTRQWAFTFLGLEASEGVGSFPQPQVVLDHAGVTTVVWTHRVDGPVGEVGVLRSARGKGAAAFAFENVEDFENGAGGAQIAVDANGHVMAVWSQRDGASANLNVFANRLDPVTGKWGTPELIDGETPKASATFGVALAMNAAGQALAAWQQLPDTGPEAVMANIFK